MSVVNWGCLNQQSKAVLIASMLLGVLSCAKTGLDCDQLPADSAQGNAGCLVVEDGKLLMIQQQFSGDWSLPGGTAEKGERAVCTAVRETREETGYQVQVERQLHQFYNGFRLYLCTLDSSVAASEVDKMEVQKLEWLDRPRRDAVPWRFEEQRELIQQLVESVAEQAQE